MKKSSRETDTYDGQENVVSVEAVREYWTGRRVPQQWYSDKTPFSLQWFNDVSNKRYSIYYRYLLDVAEFEYHGGELVLEVGTGLGTDLVQYAKNGAIVTGVDLGNDQIDITKMNFQLRDLAYKELRVGNAENLPFESSVYDLVYSFGVLHHTPNTALGIDEVHRVLKDDGMAIVMLYARGWKHYFKRCLIHGIILGKLFKNGFRWQAVYDEVSEVYGGSPRTNVYTKRQIKKMFKRFPNVVITKHRLGEFIDYAPYNSRVLPSFVKNIFDLFRMESLIGENWIIKAYKAKSFPSKSVFDVLTKHY